MTFVFDATAEGVTVHDARHVGGTYLIARASWVLDAWLDSRQTSKHTRDAARDAWAKVLALRANYPLAPRREGD